MSKLDRRVLAQFLPNPQAIAAFERMASDVNEALPEATATAQDTADQAYTIATVAKSNAESLRPLLDMLLTMMQTARSDRALIVALGHRVTELETRILALQRSVNTEPLRRQLNDLQALQIKR
ncbi:hypothetical protein [Massilia phyllosphaerae]|uniref:hypothetical protein n=1 Tax=Massilia phyllosphaerae TaxID=3106034 RepID=UPI002B1CB3FD|nr:hypothetical protein [Massilia sp. SGZ-792]